MHVRGVRSSLLPLLCAGALLAGSCARREAKVLATVGQEKISVGEVAEIMAGGGYSMDADGVREAMGHLVDFRLLLEGARKEKIQDSPEYRRDLRQMRDDLFLRKLYDKVVLAQARATDEELRKYFDENKLGEEQIKARHIMISIPGRADEQVKAELRRKAEEALAAVRAGQDFTEISRKYSDGPAALNGGDLGYFGRGRMVKSFEDAAFALAKEQMSDIVETRYGYHIIKVEDRRQRAFEEVKEEVRPYVEQPKIQELSQKFIDEVEKKGDVKYLDAGIAKLLEVFERGEPRPTGAEGRIPVARFRGGEWAVQRYVEFYNDFPAEYRIPPKTADEVKNVLKGALRNELLLLEAKRRGVQRGRKVREELKRIDDDALVQRYITKKVYEGPELSEEEVRAYYEAHKAEYDDKLLDEVRGMVRQAVLDERHEARLEELTAPLRREFPVRIIEENISLALELVTGRQKGKASS